VDGVMVVVGLFASVDVISGGVVGVNGMAVVGVVV
jgi:hypothetical protein